MAKLYLVQKLADLVHQRITELKMTMGILLPSLETALAYRKLDGFDNICNDIDEKIVATFSALPAGDQHRFYKQHRQDNPELVAALIQLMVEKEPAASETEAEVVTVNMRKFYKFYQAHKEEKPELVNALVDLMPDFVLGELVGCTNCKMPKGNCKDGKDIDVVPHQGMRFNVQGYRLGMDTISRVESVTLDSIAGGKEEFNVKVKREYNGKICEMKYPKDFPYPPDFFPTHQTYLCKI